MELNSSSKEDTNTTTIIGIVILPDTNSYSFERFTENFTSQYGKIDEVNGDNISSNFKIGEEEAYILNIPTRVPHDDIESTVKYAYNWSSALEDLKSYKAHLIIALPNGNNDTISRFRLHTQLICSLLKTSDAVGVYLGEQSLLINKRDYIHEAQFMSESYLPLNIWVYFGLRTIDGKNNGYTYGLKVFGREELEIINSEQDLSEIRDMLFNISHYILKDNPIFIDGQTMGYSEHQKLSISYSKARFVGGDSFKFSY